MSLEMNGSWATTRMPNARARCATSWPMRPRPAMPSVLPRSSVPRKRFFSHLPSFIARSAAGIDARQREHQRAGVLGDADAVGAGRVDDEDAARAGRGDVDVVDAGAGAGDDAEPRRRVEQRRASTFVALRTSSASASARSAASVGGLAAGARVHDPARLRRGAGPAPRPAGRRRQRFSMGSCRLRRVQLIAESHGRWSMVRRCAVVKYNP